MKLPGCLVSCLLVSLIFPAPSGRSEANTELIRIATTVPKSSPVGTAFHVWALAVSAKSGGKLTLEISYDGQHGDDLDMVRKIQEGRIDGGLLAEAGLARVYEPALAFQLPGLFANWAELDAARDNLKAELDKGANEAGFGLVGWTDFGVRRMMAKGFTVKTPEDLKGKKACVGRGDRIQPALYEQIGGITSVPLDAPEVLPALGTGAINVINTSALQAEQLQWSFSLDTINSDGNAYLIGAIVVSWKRVRDLPDDLRAILLDTGKIATNAMRQRNRQQDSAAYERLKGRMTVVDLASDDLVKWSEAYKNVRRSLTPVPFSPDLVAKLESASRNH